MGVSLIKKDIKTNELICQRVSQTMVESDIIVPVTMPDVSKIIDISGNVCITDKVIQQDKIFIQGIVRFTALYLPDFSENSHLQSLRTSQEFNHTIDCRGVRPDMHLNCEASIESFDHTLINSRKVNLRSMLALGVKVTKPIVLSLACGLENQENIAIRQERIRLMSGTDANDCQIILREQLEFPSGKPTIGEILKITAEPKSTELCIMDGKAVAKGEVRVSSLYNSEDDNSVQFMEHTIPFTEILNIDGAVEGMSGEIEYSLGELYWEVRENSDGESRCLGIEMVLGANVRGTEISEVDAIVDAYSVDDGLELTTKSYHLEQLLDNSTAEITHKSQAHIPAMLPKLNQVCDVTSTAKIERIAVENQQITVFGIIRTNIIYFTKDETVPISFFCHTTEFSHSFDVPGSGTDTVCDAQIYIQHTSYTLSGDDSLELRYILGLTLKSLNTGEIILVEEMAPFTPEQNCSSPCIILYFVEKGDSLWSIAKKYHTTIEDIKRLNNLDGDLIYPGQQLKILAGGGRVISA